MTDLAAALLRDVPRFSLIDGPHHPFMGYATSGEYMHVSDVLAALSHALDPVLAERAGEVVERLRGDMPEMRPNRGWGWREDINLVAVEAERKEAADLITALLAQNAALRAERDAIAKKHSDLQDSTTEHCTECVKGSNALRLRLAEAEAEVEKLRGAVWLKVGECLAGMTHREVSPAARRMIEKAILAALTTEADNG